MTTFVFPGQGSQFTGMTKDFYDNFIVARDIVELISDTTKIDIKDIIFNEKSELINQTKYTQIAIYAASMSIYKVLDTEIDLSELDFTCMMGHSLGEYSALSASKILSIQDCSLLLKLRGELMQNAIEPNKSGMAAIIGLSCNQAELVIKSNELNIEIANDNSPSQVVISGINNDISGSEVFFIKAGAKKFISLNVSAAFHSKLMINAQKELRFFINNVNFQSSKIPIISNYSAKISNNIDDIVDDLGNQMSNRVRWTESILSLNNLKNNKIIEIGPGKVLGGLIKRINSNFNVVSINKIDDIEKLKNGI